MNKEKDTLKHVGILGMKWGIRRIRGQGNSADYKSAKKIKRKKLSEMSNEEIKELSNRLRLEKELKDLSPGKLAGGKKILGDVLSSIGKATMNQASNMVASKIVDSVMKKVPVQG